MVFLRILLPFLIVATLGLRPLPVLAQAAGAQGDDFLYRAQPGDTLIGLASQYTLNPSNWATLQNLNKVPEPTRLQIGRTIRIPFALIPEIAAGARITHQTGQATVNGGTPATTTQIAEGSTINTGPGGFITLRLDDGSVLTVPSLSSLTLSRLRAFKGTGLTDSIIHVQKGTLESVVAPKDTGVGRFEVRTPLSVTGVRGTRLRVRISDQGTQSEVLKGQAHLNSALLVQDATLRANQGTAVDSHGAILSPRVLLSAPVLPASDPNQGAGTLNFEPVPGAAAYLVRVSSDAAGTNPVSSHQFQAPPVTYRAPGAGTYYVAVRAIDNDGIQGQDAVQAFRGISVLTVRDGTPALSGFGQPIQLADY